MRVMIMAAGKGTRLRPLTDLMPKPMVPIVNRPALYHVLRLLARHGFAEVVINLHHLPEAISSYFGDGSLMGVDIRYSLEERLLGTAGGVKNNQGFFGGETFLVMSGDALTDIDLTALVAGHRRLGGIATMAVKEVDDPSLYGVVVVDDDQRVTGFQEKPARERARSRLCNCGIYVFEPEMLDLIPPGRFDDFGTRVFPDLLESSEPFYAVPVETYWSDVGNIGEFVRGNFDALAGRVRVEIPGGERAPGFWMGAKSELAKEGAVEPPVLIGDRCRVEEGVLLEGPVVVGDGCVIGRGSHICRGIVLPGTVLPAESVLVEGVVGHRLVGSGLTGAH